MLIQLQPTAGALPSGVAIPDWLKQLADSSLDTASLPAIVSEIIGRRGYTTMLYGTAKTSRRGDDEGFYFWTTVPAEWVAEYDRNSYVEVDPRIAYGWDSPPPLIWDSSLGDGDAQVAHSLDRAGTFGIGSGLALYSSEEGVFSAVFTQPPSANPDKIGPGGDPGPSR